MSRDKKLFDSYLFHCLSDDFSSDGSRKSLKYLCALADVPEQNIAPLANKEAVIKLIGNLIFVKRYSKQKCPYFSYGHWGA